MVEIVDIITALGQLGLWLQTIGAIVILWIIFQTVAWAYNRKRMKEIYAIKGDMKRIEKKIDRVLERK